MLSNGNTICCCSHVVLTCTGDKESGAKRLVGHRLLRHGSLFTFLFRIFLTVDHFINNVIISHTTYSVYTPKKSS